MISTSVVGFDGYFHEHPASGSGQYALNLWRELEHLAENDMTFRLLAPSARSRLRGKTRKIFWEQAGLPRSTRRLAAQLAHVPYFSAPLVKSVPFVATIHDVIPLALPAYARTRQMNLYLRLVARAVRGCKLIITDSNYSRDDIVRRLKIPCERIRVTPLGVSEEYSPPRTYADEESIGRLRERFSLHRPFVLNVGGFDVRKRLPQLVEGFALATRDLETEYDLVIVGSPHSDNLELFPPIQPLINASGLNDRVHLVGFVSEADKRDLYRATEVFAFTSEYEGFGLDPLEAMACGAPVLCSNRTSLPEVVGNAALLVEPEPRAIAEALGRLLNSPDLRADFALRGIARAREFSWRRTADATVRVYREVLGVRAAAA